MGHNLVKTCSNADQKVVHRDLSFCCFAAVMKNSFVKKSCIYNSIISMKCSLLFVCLYLILLCHVICSVSHLFFLWSFFKFLVVSCLYCRLCIYYRCIASKQKLLQLKAKQKYLHKSINHSTCLQSIFTKV